MYECRTIRLYDTLRENGYDGVGKFWTSPFPDMCAAVRRVRNGASLVFRYLAESVMNSIDALV